MMLEDATSASNRWPQQQRVEVHVLSGIKEGETVILYPGDKVKDGLRVQSLMISSDK